MDAGDPRFKTSTVSRRFPVAAGFYRTCVIDGLLDHSPAEHARHPSVPPESPTPGFTHLQSGALLTAAGESPHPCDFALAAMLLGLRIFEATGADIAGLSEEHGHRVRRGCGKGTKIVLLPPPPAVSRAIDQAIGARTRGPILLNGRGARMDRHAATRRLTAPGRSCRRADHQAAPSHAPPHLRHTMDVGVDLRDVQIAARHARTTMRYNRAADPAATRTTSWPPTWPPAPDRDCLPWPKPGRRPALPMSAYRQVSATFLSPCSPHCRGCRWCRTAAMSDKPVSGTPSRGEQWGCGGRVPGRFRGSSSALGEPGPERVTNPCHARPRPAWRWLGRASMVEPMASVRQIQVTSDCAEPERVARFWCEVLGYVVPPPPEGFATWDDFDRALPPEHQGSAFACIDPSGVGSRLFFQRVPEGKVVKNRLHFDVRVGTGLVGRERLAALEAECARLVALGAARVRLLPADGDNESCLVMQDIEGNEFCLD